MKRRYRNHQKGGGLFSAIEHQQSYTQRKTGILKLRELIDWEGFRPLLEEVTGYDRADPSRGGRPPFDPVLMFQVLVLQYFHGLSDEATEEQILDRTSFKTFLGLQIGDDIPDARTIWDFKERIEAEGRDGARRLFEHFNAQLESRGLIGREGSIVDASFIDAPRQRNSREENAQIKEGKVPQRFQDKPALGRQKDLDARWSKKNTETHYGYKNHIKADARTKFILKSETTPANVHDSRVFEQLLDEQDRAILADSAYHSQAAEEVVLALHAEEFLMRKGQRNRPLSPEEAATNHTISRMRVRVEHIFARMAQMGTHVCRSIGLARARRHNHLANLVYNMDRHALMA